jgi:molybdopterin molybdotransferase
MTERRISMPLLPVDEARARILKGVKPLAAEGVHLPDALGRVLARDVKAKRDQPPFDSSAMDGYALRIADAASAPAKLKTIGMSAAGHGFSGRIKAGEAVRIFTGAPVPKGADTVVIQENTEAQGDRVTITQAPNKGQNIRSRGLDFAKGDIVLRANTILTARDLGLAAAANHAELPVRRKPHVAILATGDELVPPGGLARADQIFASNGFALQGFISRFGGEARDLGIVRDDLKATMRAIARAGDAQVLITTGGASVGMHDLVQEALTRSGIKLDFWKIAMRPGKPLMFARHGRQRIIGLPGNPVSALVCARIFLKPLLSAFLGLPSGDDLIQARLAAPLPQNDQRQDYLRARLGRSSDGSYRATAFPKQDSSMQRTLAEAQGLIVRPPFAPAAAADDIVPVLPLDF